MLLSNPTVLVDNRPPRRQNRPCKMQVCRRQRSKRLHRRNPQHRQYHKNLRYRQYHKNLRHKRHPLQSQNLSPGQQIQVRNRLSVCSGVPLKGQQQLKIRVSSK